MRIANPPSNVPDAKEDITQALYTLVMNVAEAASQGRMLDSGKDSLTRGACGNIADTIENLVNANCSPPVNKQMIRERFEKDADEWKWRSRHMSIVYDMMVLPSYQRIIGLGPAAVPLIIERLRTDRDHWFFALVAIVGEDKAVGAKTVPEAAQCWIDWYDENHPNN